MARLFPGGVATDRIVTDTGIQGSVLFSMACWVKPTAYDASGRRLWDWRDSVTDASFNNRLNLVNPGGGSVLEFLSSWTGAGVWTVVAPSTGSWHHLGITYDAGSTSNVPVIYLDGSPVTVTTLSVPTGTFDGTFNANLCLGCRNISLSSELDAALAEFALWNRVLTAREMAGLAKGFAPGLLPRGQIFYDDLIGRRSPELWRATGTGGTATVTGTTPVDHPRTLYPIGLSLPAQDSTPAPTGSPFTLRQSTLRGGDALRGVAAGGSGLSATVNQVTETDTAQPITVNPKRRLIAQTVEADLAQVVTRNKRTLMGQSSETDLAQPILARKTRSVGQAVETDLAQAIAKLKRKALGQSTEADLAQAVTSKKTRPLGQTTETDAAQAVVHQKQKLLGQTTETETAQALARLKTKLIGQTAETDLAQAITRAGGLSVAVNPASETDQAQAITVNPRRRLVGQVVENDVAQSVAHLKRKTLGQASESDGVQPITARKMRLVNLTVETDLSQPIVARKLRGVALASETDVAQALTHAKVKAMGQAQEVDAALPLIYAVFLVGYIRIVNLSGRLPTGRMLTGRLPQAVGVMGRLSTCEGVAGSMASLDAIAGRLPTAADVTGVL